MPIEHATKRTATLLSYDMDFYSPWAYEITITYNPTLHSRASEFQNRHKVPLYLNGILETLPFDTFVSYVMEYTKSKRLHWHICVSSNDEIPVEWRGNVVRGLVRQFGRSTFSDVANIDSFSEYIQKDLATNFEEKGFCHYEQFFISEIKKTKYDWEF